MLKAQGAQEDSLSLEGPISGLANAIITILMNRKGKTGAGQF